MRELKTGEVYCEICGKIIKEKNACTLYTDEEHFIICCESCYDKHE